MQTETCKKCGEPKDYTIKSGKRAGKLHTYCRKCLAAQGKDWTSRNRGRVLKNQRRWILENPDKRLRYGMRRYGVDEIWFKAKLEEQCGICALCDKAEDSKHVKIRARLSVDHNHKTGEPRGLLCNTCNMRLAGLESQKWFQRAEAYLKKYP